MPAEEAVVCAKCNVQTAFKDTLPYGTKRKCRKCNSLMGRLRTMYGAWPTVEFKGLNSIQQAAFYAKSAGLNKSELEAVVVDTISVAQTQSTTVTMKSEYRPLKYWGQLGYDVKKIEENAMPEDVRESASTGVCYRIQVESLSESIRKETKQEQVSSRTSQATRPSTRRPSDDETSSSVARPKKKPKARERRCLFRVRPHFCITSPRARLYTSICACVAHSARPSRSLVRSRSRRSSEGSQVPRSTWRW